MVPETFEVIAFYVAFIRDVVLLLLLLAILIIVFLIYRKVSQAMSTANRIMRDTEEIVATVSDSLVRPAAAGSGVAFGMGKAVAFLRGARRRQGGRGNG
jgi:hypothetical protein